MFTLLSLCLVLFASSPVTAISPISFFVRGVAYVPGAGRSDPLGDTEQCKIDAAMIKQVGANTVYVYSVDPRNDHDGCMREFASQGIYVWPQMGDFPRATGSTQDGPEWTISVFNGWTAILDAFAGYDNVLALGIGQETITSNSNSTTVAPSLKAAARDLRAYRHARGYRAIPLSYSVADAEQLRLATAQYLACGDTAAATIDLIGLNIFLQCAAADWQALAAQFRTLPVPVVISESGCRPAPESARNFSDVALVLRDPALSAVFSGVSVYEWAMQKLPPYYGVVSYATEARTGRPAPLPQYARLSAVFGAAAASAAAAAAAATGTPAARYTPGTAAPLACPTRDVGAGWLVEAGAVLPTIPGLEIGGVSATGTGAGAAGSQATGAAGGDGGDGGDATSGATSSGQRPRGGLAGGAIAGIVIGVLCALFVALGIFAFRRQRRRQCAEATAPHEIQSHCDKPPPSYQYHYPAGKVELPTHNMAAVEMDGAPPSVSSGRTLWKLPTQGEGDSPTVAVPGQADLPDRRWWRRTRQFELEDTAHTAARTGVSAGAGTGTWQVSPLSPGSKYV
ncbi:glycoside hydrolase family 72 protein [Trichocladium antarcticum]|uniref:1,3-beta-glucanosyltransferase n=1 Tax=Trichocladium antarcticum TaxID=1450529 RepID=A0AAN6UGC1_9PEZI|nr:glycoside hydrolase family 72 protein [Trichocladium antarcticum]